MRIINPKIHSEQFIRFGLWKVIGGCVVFAGVGIAVIPPVFSASSVGSVIWIISTATNVINYAHVSPVFFSSNFPLAAQNVWQEILFMRYIAFRTLDQSLLIPIARYYVNELHCVVWTSFYTVIGILLSLPLRCAARYI